MSAIRLKGGEKTKFSPGLLTTFSSYEIFILMRQSFCMFSQRWPDLFLYKRSPKGGHAHFLYVLQEVARIFFMFSQRWARLVCMLSQRWARLLLHVLPEVGTPSFACSPRGGHAVFCMVSLRCTVYTPSLCMFSQRWAHPLLHVLPEVQAVLDLSQIFQINST